MPVTVERDGDKIILIFGADERWSGMRLTLSLKHARVLVEALRKVLDD